MPPPLVQIPASLSQGGKCLSNLRGVTPSAPYDYVSPSRTFTVGADLGTIATGTSEPWMNTIQKAYTSTNSDGSATITYSGLLSDARTGSLVFRMYIQPFADPSLVPLTQTVFQNGQAAVNGYGIFLTHDEIGDDEFEYNIHFGRLQDDSKEWLRMNQDPLGEEKWYQFSIRFTTPSGVLGDTSTITVYQNGSPSIDEQELWQAIDTPTLGPTFLFGFFGRMTDFAFLDSKVSNNQLAAYGTAPYI